MSQMQFSKPSEPFYPSTSEPAEAFLSTIIYRSRAKSLLSRAALESLLHDAQSRNRDAAVTGLMVYDHPRFYQWLEGEAESLARIMASIRRDPRHTDLEILSHAPIPARVFSGWSMKLALPGAEPGLPRHDYVHPRAEIIQELRQHPACVPALLATFARNPQATKNPPLADVHFTSRIGESLQTLIRDTVIPNLAARHSLPPARPVLALADLLLASDTDTALNLIHEQIGARQSPLPFYPTLLEPAARRLGDLWLQDACSEFDLTVALGHLQAAVRILGGEFTPRWLSPNAAVPNVLVVPLPGELHGLGAALDSEAMWHQGWAPQSEFPYDNAGLQKILKNSCFDVLDLTTSIALRREHWVMRMAETVRLARRASRNPDLVVMVGGRIFTEHGAGAQDVNADAVHKTAANITHDILMELPQRVAAD